MRPNSARTDWWAELEQATPEFPQSFHNSIGDPNPFWYTPAGGAGAIGNKIMEANTYVEIDPAAAGATITFSASVLSNTLFGRLHSARTR
jgi:hypothetical protein